MPALYTYVVTQERKVEVRASSALEAHQVAEESLDSTHQDNVDNRRPVPEITDVRVAKEYF